MTQDNRRSGTGHNDLVPGAPGEEGEARSPTPQANAPQLTAPQPTAPKPKSGSSVILLSLMVYGLLLLALFTRNGEILVLSLPFIFFLAAAYIFAPKTPELKIDRRINNRSLSDRPKRSGSDSQGAEAVSPGRPVSITTTVTNQGGDIEEILISDLVPDSLEIIEGVPFTLTTLPSKETIEIKYTVRGNRGSYPIDRMDVQVSDHLSLSSHLVVLKEAVQFHIKPEVWRLRSIPIRPRNTHLYTGPIPARRGGAGMNFFEVREYEVGDSLRRINWKVTSRSGFYKEDAIFTNQFELERVSDVGIILDARQQTNVTLRNVPENLRYPSLFEYSANAAAALADLFIRDGHRVGLLIYGRGQQATFPGYGKSQRERILRALAQARTGDNMALENLSYLPVRFFPPRSQIVLVSSLSPADPPILTRLLANGYRLLVISPDPVAYEAASLPQSTDAQLARRFARVERVLLLRRLQSFGITVIDWDVTIPLEKVLGSSLLRAPGEYRRIGIGL